MNESTIKVENLSFQYYSRDEPAIREISFEVPKGELLLIAGASGCGKTTLSRCINGLIPRSYHGEMTGSVYLNGKDIMQMSLVDISQSVGTLLQDPERQIVASKVFNEIAFGPENLGIPRDVIISRINNIAQQLRIEYLLDRETFNLSGGEKQKVAMAGLLVMQPSILLLDEPLASLDSASVIDALDMFKELSGKGITVIIVEHRVEDVLRIKPDRLMYMDDGRIQYLGPIDHLPPEIDHTKVKLPAQWLTDRIKNVPLDPVVPKSSLVDGEIVRFSDVSFSYDQGSRQILNKVNLSIRKGDLIALLGPNGSGKSTLVKHAIGLLKPSFGDVFVNGKNTRDISIATIAHTLGYVFQSPSHMLFAPTVQEELEFGPRNLGFNEEEIIEGVSKSVYIMNLGGLEIYPPLGLSFGQQKRTTIASVLAMRSRIFIMDEPTAGQDFYNYTRFMNSLWNPDGDNLSIVNKNFDASMLITHDVDLAVTYANRVIIFDKGTVVADGSPEEVLTDQALLDRSRIVQSSLLQLNNKYFPITRRILPIEQLINFVI